MNKAGLSIHAAPYRVELISGKVVYASNLRDIYEGYRQERTSAVFDRKANSFLDLAAIWTSHRRKLVTNEQASRKK